jgi:hypothetical protein
MGLHEIKKLLYNKRNGHQDGMWWMGFIYVYETELETSCSCFKWGGKGFEAER